MLGYLETLSSAFASGWASYNSGSPSSVYAVLGTEILGLAVADRDRHDLLAEAERLGGRAGSFFMLFNRSVTPEEQDNISIRVINSEFSLRRLSDIKPDPYPVRQIFIFGSPRSGTSEMGATLAKTFKLPWLGEFHAAPLFADPAAKLSGDAASEQELSRFLAAHKFSAVMQNQAKLTYYAMHGSASFLDKTPGIPMIRSAPFLAACFPQAKFIYLQRNGISNVLSRMAKFGGNFEEHCNDWVAALNEWAAVRDLLPHHLELRQEDMQDNPGKVALKIANYLNAPHQAPAIEASLRTGSLERTGAGTGRTQLAETGWSQEQTATFLRLCGPTMQRFGYKL